VVFTQVIKHYMLLLLPAMAIWKYGRVSIEIASPTISTLHVWTNLKVVFTQASKQLILVAVLSILKSNRQAKLPTQIACVNEP